MTHCLLFLWLSSVETHMCVSEHEYTHTHNTQVGMVKISMPGMSKLRQDEKKNKKAAAKSKHS